MEASAIELNERRIFWFCGTSHFMAHAYMLLFPSLALWIHAGLDLELGATLELGFFMYFLFGVLAPLAGFLGDRFSGHRLLVIMLLGVGAGSLWCAISKSPTSLMLGLATVGSFAAIYHPVGMGLISHCCARRGQALGRNGLWGSLGIGLGPFLAGAAGYTLGWRGAFALYGVLTLLLGAWFAFWKIDETHLPRTPSSEGNEKKAGGDVRFFVMMLGCMTLFGFSYRAMTVSLPAYFEVSLSGMLSLLPGAGAVDGARFGVAALVSLIYLGSMPAQLVGGHLADTWDLRRAYLLFHALSLPFVFAMAWVGGPPLFLAALGYAFFSIGMQPIENSLVAHLTPPKLRGLGYGMKFILVFGVGALSVRLVRTLVDGGELPELYLWLSALTLAEVGVIILIAFFSRGREWRNA